MLRTALQVAPILVASLVCFAVSLKAALQPSPVPAAVFAVAGAGLLVLARVIAWQATRD